MRYDFDRFFNPAGGRQGIAKVIMNRAATRSNDQGGPTKADGLVGLFSLRTCPSS